MTIANLKTFIAVYMGRATSADLTLNGLDTALIALNAARRKAEQAHDFKYSEQDVYLSITAAGGLLTACYPEVGLTDTIVGVKRVQNVSLPVASSGYQPIEFMGNDEWIARTKRQIGRQPYDASKTLTQLGVTANLNPVCYQIGQTLFLDPAPGTTTVQLGVVRWLPEYTVSETDFFTDLAPEYLQWAAILECNKFWRRFVDKQESNIDEKAVTEMRDEALASLIAWDTSTARGTSTPSSQAGPQKG